MAYIDSINSETLKNIARQMAIANKINLLRELYELGAISKEEYVNSMTKLEKFC